MISRSWIQTPVIDQISGCIITGFSVCFSAQLARDSSHTVRLWTDTWGQSMCVRHYCWVREWGKQLCLWEWLCERQRSVLSPGEWYDSGLRQGSTNNWCGWSKQILLGTDCRLWLWLCWGWAGVCERWFQMASLSCVYHVSGFGPYPNIAGPNVTKFWRLLIYSDQKIFSDRSCAKVVYCTSHAFWKWKARKKCHFGYLEG